MDTEYRLLRPRRRLFGISTTSPTLTAEDLTSESSDDNIFPHDGTGPITRSKLKRRYAMPSPPLAR